MSQAHPRGAFVRGNHTIEWFATLAAAEEFAAAAAQEHWRMSYYTGYVDSDPREHTRWQWNAEERKVIRYACND